MARFFRAFTTGRVHTFAAVSCATLLLAAFASATLQPASAQAPAPKAAAAPGGKARLTLTRVSGLMYSGAPATVKVNGKKVADVWSGSSAVVDISPGATAVTVDAWSYPGSWTVNLNAKAGESYALEISPRSASLGPSMLLGPLGGAIDAGANRNAGAFQMQIVKPQKK